MQDALITTTAIAVLLFVGVLCSWLSNKFRIPDMMLLILMGIFFGHLDYKGESLVQFPEVFLSSLAILALAMIVFDSTARLRLKELDTFSFNALKLTITTIICTLVLFTAAAHYILGVPVWSGLLFAAVMSGTAPEAMLPAKGKGKALTLLKMESIFNTPLTVIIPFLVLDLMQNITNTGLTEIVEQMLPFVMKFIVGIGSGVFVGIILFKIVQRVYAEVYSPLAVIVSALLSFVLAENLGGSGVLAVTALGLFFGNVYVKEKITLLGIETVFAKALYILVFILTGVIIQIPFTKEFFITSFILFTILVFIRFIGVWLACRPQYSTKDIVFMSLVAPKGVATAAVVFILAVEHADKISTVLDMTFAFILYSIILASITEWVKSFHEKRTS